MHVIESALLGHNGAGNSGFFLKCGFKIVDIIDKSLVGRLFFVFFDRFGYGRNDSGNIIRFCFLNLGCFRLAYGRFLNRRNHGGDVVINFFHHFFYRLGNFLHYRLSLRLLIIIKENLRHAVGKFFLQIYGIELADIHILNKDIVLLGSCEASVKGILLS